MDICPNCKSKLNIDEKSSGKCFSCGTTFESSLPKGNTQFNYQSSGNTVAKAIKTCGIAIIIVGTILSFIVAGGSGGQYEFSLIQFITPEFMSIIGGLIFIGFSEIIQLLEDIKNKLK
ncbi:hypothetical protein [uncultured Muribaculum sp.]|uniref:hypothetical protein n=1 Tax=uncultured Muribaculum sp. TaxID=1918613 RepID=UPI00266EB08F|nr:hypothetical protein [uncultured Muribaculum sp.]